VPTGIVLAGGASTRFGADKLSAPYRGTPLVLHAIGRLSGLCEDVVVVLAPGADTAGLPPGVRTTNDAEPGQGPLAGLLAGLLASPRADVALVVGGDMPDLQTAVARELLRVVDEAAVDAAVLVAAGRSRPLPCVVRVRPATERVHALLHEGHRRLRDAIDGLRTAAVDEATWTSLDPARRSVFDVDEPEDLNR